MTLDALNALEPPAFVHTLGGIFEHSPWVAEEVLERRPFASVQALHHALLERVRAAPETRQLALIRAHPDLGAKLGMTPESVLEQHSLGLDRLTPELFERFSALNARYRARFDFPFIVCVRNQSGVQAILENFETRLAHSPAQEQREALEQIGEIARHRLNALFD